MPWKAWLRANFMRTISKLVWKYSARMASSDGTCNRIRIVKWSLSMNTSRTKLLNKECMPELKSAPSASRCARAMSCMWLQLWPSHLRCGMGIKLSSASDQVHLKILTCKFPKPLTKIRKLVHLALQHPARQFVSSLVALCGYLRRGEQKSDQCASTAEEEILVQTSFYKRN